jgi:hypothetical protein
MIEDHSGGSRPRPSFEDGRRVGAGAQNLTAARGPLRPRKLFVFFETGFSQAYGQRVGHISPFLEIVASGLWITRITRPARDGAYMAP